MSEEWRRIEGFDEYEVSDQGRVRSWRKYRGTPVPRILAQTTGTTGYLYVCLTRDGERPKKRRIHQLVTGAFIGPCPEGRIVRHLDGNQLNNHRDNVTYGTYSENMYDRRRHGTDPMARRTHCNRGHEFSPENTYVRPNGARNCRTCEKWTFRGRVDPRKGRRAA